VQPQPPAPYHSSLLQAPHSLKAGVAAAAAGAAAAPGAVAVAVVAAVLAAVATLAPMMTGLGGAVGCRSKTLLMRLNTRMAAAMVGHLLCRNTATSCSAAGARGLGCLIDKSCT
jgi:hypothetical protein